MIATMIECLRCYEKKNNPSSVLSNFHSSHLTKQKNVGIRDWMTKHLSNDYKWVISIKLLANKSDKIKSCVKILFFVLQIATILDMEKSANHLEQLLYN